jgi:hypothetical protein
MAKKTAYKVDYTQFWGKMLDLTGKTVDFTQILYDISSKLEWFK